MASQARIEPRKQPRQARAQATVDVVLRATAHILVEQGYDRITTNHVAERAGVSIGSIYQYFPSKEALVAALVDRHLDRMVAIIGGELALAIDKPRPFAEGTRRIIDALIDAHSVDPPLHRAILEQVPRIGRMQRIREIDTQFEALVAAGLAARGGDLDAQDLRLTAFMLVHSAKGLILAALFEHPDYITDGRLAAELTRMFVRYIGKK